MDSAIKQEYILLADKLIMNLEKRGFIAYYCPTVSEVNDKIFSLISKDKTIAWGGSVTLEQLGIIEKLYDEGYTLIDRDNAKTPEERITLMKQSLLCDTYLASANAITMDGILIHIDGNGNRVAAITYGPESVILVVSMQKVCATIEMAEHRARNYAAPVNAIRLHTNTPCKKTGECHHCQNDESICSYILKIRRSKPKGRIKVVLTPEPLGF